jgi:hypothetical protein
MLSGKLEFFDFRELQETIVNKLVWPRFEARFATKEAVIANSISWPNCETAFVTAALLMRLFVWKAKRLSYGLTNSE